MGFCLDLMFTTLFDLGLIAVRPDTHAIVLATPLLTSPYADLNGQYLRLPREPTHRPEKAALEWHYRKFFHDVTRVRGSA